LASRAKMSASFMFKPRGVQFRVGNSSRLGCHHSESTLTKMREAWTHRGPVSQGDRDKMRIAHLGHFLSDETKAKISIVNMNHPVSAETREKLRDAHRGRIYHKRYTKSEIEMRRKSQRRKFCLKKHYDLTEDKYNNLLADQGGVCAVCGTSAWGGRSNSPVVDHDHKSGEVRGILCSRCNLVAGQLNDDPALAQLLWTYLLGKKKVT